MMRDVIGGLGDLRLPAELFVQYPLRMLDALRADPLRLQMLRLVLATEPERMRRAIRDLGQHGVLGAAGALHGLADARSGGRSAARHRPRLAPAVPAGQRLRPGLHGAGGERGHGLRPRGRRRTGASTGKTCEASAAPRPARGRKDAAMLTTLTALALAAGLVTAPADTARLDLQTCLALAQEHGAAPGRGAGRRGSGAAAADEADARRLPTLGFGATYRYTSEIMEPDQPGAGPITQHGPLRRRARGRLEPGRVAAAVHRRRAERPGPRGGRRRRGRGAAHGGHRGSTSR